MHRYLIVAAALVAIPAWPQVPRNGSQQQQKSQSDKAQTQSAPQTAVSNVQVKPATPEKPDQSQTEPEGYHFRELWAPANIPNWVLAALAGWAGFMALRTLWAIKAQADHMERQNSLAFNEKRPRMALLPCSWTSLANSVPVIQMRVTNIGGSKAIFGMCLAGMKATKVGEVPESTEGDYPLDLTGEILQPDVHSDQYIRVRLGGEVFPPRIESIAAARIAHLWQVGFSGRFV
ncbi:MAG TPA: hypothetical protein VG714_06450 [Acidobacteriaceae bacterium]|nr:hypothetical protein [Acidobacteriaceae bacterium]